jgi:two-component system response regulator YesN
MYKVLIVDDERIIREGMSNAIEWEDYGLSVCGAAFNGIEACEIIEKQRPNIVITDIKMPGMNGLELIEKIHTEYPDIIFVVLSGYGEFSYAQEAMRFGVKHYLLKPSDDDEIIATIEEIVSELKEKEKSEEVLKVIDYNFKKVLPQAEKQFFNELIDDGDFNEEEIEYFLQLFEIKEDKFKLVALKTNKQGDYLEKYALRNIAYDVIKKERVCLSTLAEDSILLLIKSIESNELADLLSQIKEYFNRFFKYNISIGVSSENSFKNIRKMYAEVQEALKCEENPSKNYGSIINTVIECVNENIQNPQLSLTWVAKEVLFMNENYLGKLFHKVTNEKFSQYVMKLRMEKAKELIKSDMDYKIYEITEQIGLEDNTQYFSQVFKKYTGYTPSEYKKL